MLRTQVDVVLADGAAVLNAADQRVAGMAPLCDGEVIFYGVDERRPLSRHRARAARRVVFRAQDRIVLANGGSESLPAWPGRLTAWRATAAASASRALLAAVAAGWALGMPPNLIGAGVEAFEADLQRRAGLAAAVAHRRSSPQPQFV